MATGWLEWVEVGCLGVEFVWNDGRLAGEILILGAELGLDMLKWDVRVGKEMYTMEIVWIVRPEMSVHRKGAKRRRGEFGYGPSGWCGMERIGRSGLRPYRGWCEMERGRQAGGACVQADALGEHGGSPLRWRWVLDDDGGGGRAMAVEMRGRRSAAVGSDACWAMVRGRRRRTVRGQHAGLRMGWRRDQQVRNRG